MNCRICNNKVKRIFSAKILDKYNVEYYYCNNCGFLQTEEPYWLEEAYKEPINILDTGIIARNINLLRNHISCRLMGKVHLFPAFVDPSVYPKESPDKLFDIIQIGRRNTLLHEWAIRYSNERHGSYLYQKNNSRGMYYFEDRDWKGKNFQLSYSSLVKTLAASKIALVSPPDLTNNKRTGKVSPLTQRYLEAAMCFAVPVGFTPSSSEYKESFPGTFTIVPRNYNDFADICDQLINDDNARLEMVVRNRKYVLENHSVYSRYKQL